MKYVTFTGLVCGVWLWSCFAVQAQSHAIKNNTYYEQAFSLISEMIEGKTEYDFTKAVLATEQAYFEAELDEQAVTEYLDLLASLSQSIAANWKLEEQRGDKEHALRAAVFTALTDSIPVAMNDSLLLVHLPFQYDFDDPFGEEHWEQMFVSKLLVSKSGNCRSLPYLYKMITERLGLETHLALAPNHIYIKEFNEQNGWYNTELTSATFPVDAWLMASGYISTDAIRNGIYLKPLDQQQSLALVLTDLALGYKKKHGVEHPDFILNVLEKALEVYPDFVNAMLIKADLFTELAMRTDSKESVTRYKEQANTLYAQIHQSGYRQMPKEMYLDWIASLQTEKENYLNKNMRY